MNKIISLALTVTLMPLTVLTAGLSLTQSVIAKPSSGTIAQLVRRCTPQTCTSYRASYEKAIGNGIINRPSSVENEDQAIALAYQALNQDNRNQAALRFAQALVIISENYSPTEALAREQKLDIAIKQQYGAGIRECLPLFATIFPSNTASPPKTATPYRANYERAIAKKLIQRPSPVNDENQALDLAYEALSRNSRNEAAIRFAQALVIVSEKYSPTEALARERRLDAEMLEQRKKTLRAYLPLFESIFPFNGTTSR